MADADEGLGSNARSEGFGVHVQADSGIGIHQSGSSVDSEISASCFVPVENNLRKKLGQQCRTGPDFRVAPAEESPVSKAIRTAVSRAGEAIFLPKEGMVFNSREEAKEFYNFYSWERGFGVRFGRDRKNGALYRTRQDLICSCAGLIEDNNSSSFRTGCTAMVRLLRTKDHGYYVSSFTDEHNHHLSESFGENKQWPSHGNIDPATKVFIKRMRENNVSLGRICNILGVSDGKNPSAMRREAVRSVCSKIAQEEMRDDIGKTLKLLEEMKSSDPLMQVRFQLDVGRRIKAMLWCSGKNIMDYAKFGDAITFDTTYRTNLYSLPFGLFMGVNNHFQSIVFGGVLVTTEKAVDFEWAFKSFVEIMGGHHPNTMLTG